MWMEVLLFIAVGYSVCTDIKYRKIKNYITFPLMIAGLVYNFFSSGLEGLLFSASGMFITGFLCMFLSFVNGLGMGDVKLLMGIGAVKGLKFALAVLVYSLFSSVIISFFISPRKFIKAMKNIKNAIYEYLYFRSLPEFTEKDSAMTMAFAVHILIGLIVAYIFGGEWIWSSVF